jgi:hypothetical protein
MGETTREVKNLELYQLIISVLIVLGAVFGAWVSVNSRLSILETQQKSDEQFRVEIREILKDLSDKQTTILIKLEDKQNREK